MTRARLALALLIGALLGMGAGAAQAALPPSDALLFVVQGESGSLRPLPGERGVYELTLRDVPSHAVWFSDRPARDTGSVALRLLTGRAWRSLGFRADPPNAVVALSGGRRGADTVALELSRPRYERGGVLRFRARPLRTLSAGLVHHAPRLDRGLPRRFGAASLFVDDGWNAQTAASCSALGEVALYPRAIQPTPFLPAAGQVIPIRGREALFSIVGPAFGGVVPTSFGIPNVAAPAAGLQYQLCAIGLYPAPPPITPGTVNCTNGSIVLKAQQAVPAGWVAADGSVAGTPVVPAPQGLRYDLCNGGIAWRAGAPAGACTLGELKLFASDGLPSNWTAADGRTLQISANMVLFSLIQTAFGGDGITTFALPDPPAPVGGTHYGVCTSGSYPAL